MVKKCICCLKTKDINHFHIRSDNGKVVNTCKICVSQKRKLWYQKTKQKRDLYRRSYRLINKLKYKAHIIVSNSLQKGSIEKEACAVCGLSGEVEAHHEDYNKPLEIVWLCRPCHAKIHIIKKQGDSCKTKRS